MNSIGGFLDLEIGRASNQAYHDTPALTTGRVCFYFILKMLQPTNVHVPYYVCDALLQPLIDLNIKVSFYHLDGSLKMASLPKVTNQKELVVFVNYFGLKTDHIPGLYKIYGNQLVIDNTQAFFQKGYAGLWAFNSARKFFGVPDGAYLFTPEGFHLPKLDPAIPAYQHLINRAIGKQEEAYQQYLVHEAGLDHQIKAISEFSHKLLNQVDYEMVANRRCQNYHFLEKALSARNKLNLPLAEGEVPLYYPFLATTPIRQKLIDRNIFIPQLWPEVITRKTEGFYWEKHLARMLTPLPIDQRYGPSDMARVVDEIMRLEGI